MTRNLIETCDRIWKCIPDELLTHKLEARFDWIKTDYSFRPPENEGISWQFLIRLVEALIEVENKEYPSWLIKIYTILHETTEEEIVEYLELNSKVLDGKPVQFDRPFTYAEMNYLFNSGKGRGYGKGNNQ